MEVDKKAVGHRISLIRKRKGLTLEEFGKKTADALKSNVSKWERGLSLPNNERLKIIADLGGVSVDELLYGDERHYLAPFIIDIAKNYYDWDISKDKEMINHIFNRLNDYSYDDDEYSLLENNKDTFDRILLYPWEWNSEGIVQFTSTRIFELKKELAEIIQANIDTYDNETRKDIEKTLTSVNKILSTAKENIEDIDLDERFGSAALLKKEIEENANKEILDIDHD